MTTANAAPKMPFMPALTPTTALLVVEAAVKLTGAGAVDAFKDMLTLDAK